MISKSQSNKDSSLCSGHPDICCICCREFQDRIEQEKALYMANEKEWQGVLKKLLDEKEREIQELVEVLDLVSIQNCECKNADENLENRHLAIRILTKHSAKNSFGERK